MKKLFFVATLLISCTTLQASHIVGLDLRYAWVSGNTYQITLIAYGDCGPASSAAFSTLPTCSPQICIYDGYSYTTSINLTIQAPIDGVEITPVCPADVLLTQCTSTAYTIPGIKKFVYTGTYTVPYASTMWRFLFTGAMGGGSLTGRAAAITNIIGGTITQLVDTLNNTIGHNTNPVLSVVPTPFFCLDNNDNYNAGAVDADGDSLSFFLVDGMGDGTGGGTCTPTGAVTYIGGASGAYPLTATSFSFDQATGQISFYPNALQRSLVVYNIEEYRSGIMVGTSQREMTFLVLTCTNPPPTAGLASASNGTIDDSTHFHICANTGPFNLYINPTESVVTNNITATITGLPTGASYSIIGNGTPTPHITISWTSTGVTPGTYNFFINYADNNCPLAGEQTNAYSITIAPPPTITGTGSICVGNTLTLSGSPAGGSWVSDSSSYAAITSSTGIVTAVAAGIDTIQYTAASGCSTTATVTVSPVSDTISGTKTLCAGYTTTLYCASTGGSWSSSTATVATVGNTSGVVYGLSGGIDIITYTLLSGCHTTATITVNAVPPITGAGSICVGTTLTLADSLPSGSWTSGTPAIATIGATTGVVYGVDSGAAELSYTATTGCFVVATVNVKALPGPITGSPVICIGGFSSYSDIFTGGIYSLTNSVPATINPSTGMVSGIAVGLDTIIYTLPDGCLTNLPVTISVVPPITGTGSICAGSTITLADLLTGGTWVSLNSAIATVGSSSGIVVGLSGGIDTIQYTSPAGCVTTIPVTINPNPSPISGSLFVCFGTTGSLTNTLSGGTWVSQTPTIATVGAASGVITALSFGTTNITYTMPTGCKVTAIATVNVIQPVTGIPTLCAGSTTSLSDLSTGGNWISSNTTVATISLHSGSVVGITPGTASITYSTDSGCVAYYSVTVNQAPAPIVGPA